jgi:parallel beta-helix repeat protein
MSKPRSVAATANDNSIPGSRIETGSIIDANINSSAGIAASKLSFTQSGLGAIQRTVDSKLKDSVSVKDFGAVGDGIIDDRNAINAALASGAKSVYFPAGTYMAGGVITMGVDRQYVWSDQGAVILVKGGLPAGFGLVRLRGNFLTIDGLIFDGNLANPPGSSVNSCIGLDCQGGTLDGVTIKNTTLRGWNGYGIFSFASGQLLKNLQIENCRFLDMLNPTAGTPPAAIQLVVPNEHRNILVSGCIFDNCTGGGFMVRSNFGTNEVHNVTVTNNVFKCNWQLYSTLAVEVWNGFNITVSGNTIDNCRMGVSLAPINNCSITGNTFTNTLTYGVEAINVHNIAISGNTFEEFDHGIFVQRGSTDISITGNTFRNANPAIGDGGEAIRFSPVGSQVGPLEQTRNFVISGNTTLNTRGIVLHTSNNGTISNNSMETTGGGYNDRIVLRNPCKNISVIGNTVRTVNDLNPTFSGLIDANGEDCVFSNNLLISATVGVNAGNGIANVPEGGLGGLITNCSFISNTLVNFSFGIQLAVGNPTLFSGIALDGNRAINCTNQFSVVNGQGFIVRPFGGGFRDYGDSDHTVSSTSERVFRVNNASVSRTATLPTSGVYQGQAFQFVRGSTGVGTLNVGGIKTLSPSQWCEVTYTGAAWALTGFGSL